MRHAVLFAVLICAAFGYGWAQNRGSVRYVPSQDFDEITRAPRPLPTRGASLRRQRPTKVPETPVVDNEQENHQPADIPQRTIPRRIPNRNVSPVQPSLSPAPVAESVPSYIEPVDPPQSPVETVKNPDDKPQRRRRPKKRRRPQAPKVTEESEKTISPDDEKDKIISNKQITEEFPTNTQLRNAPANYGGNPANSAYNSEGSKWPDEAISNVPRSNVRGPQYFEPQQGTNRLPVGHADTNDNSRYSDSIPATDNPAGLSNSRYIPEQPEKSSYVPILPPIRVPSEGSSRLPHEDYSSVRNKEPARHSDRDIPILPHPTGPPSIPLPDPNIILKTGAKPAQNVIPQTSDHVIPGRSHSEIRLPEEEQPLISPEYTSGNYETPEEYQPLKSNSKTLDDAKESDNPTNRLPKPSEYHYDAVYPEYSGDPSENLQRVSRRQENADYSGRRSSSPYSSPQSSSATTPLEYDNDAEVDRKQPSQYRPPLQRAGSRYKPDDSDDVPRLKNDQAVPVSPSRTRGTSRYQEPERTRGSVRNQSMPSETPSRSRSSTASTSQYSDPARFQESRRGTQNPTENRSRTSYRRQPVPAAAKENIEHATPTRSNLPIDEVIQNGPRQPQQAPRIVYQPPVYADEESSPEEIQPARNTLRSRPQYVAEDASEEETYSEESEPTYPPPRYHRQRSSQQPRVHDEHRTQPEYQPPPNRQAPRYQAPQNPPERRQVQYQTPQNSRQAGPRQPPSNPRQQSSARQQHQPEPQPTRGRSTGGSKFTCPDSFGFFADPVQCDKYYECRNGSAELHLCNDGLAFNEASAPKFLRCDSLRDVDCSSRPELQEPKPTKNCPRRFGLFAHETDCTKFWNCVDGAATEVQCPPGLTYNDERATCDWADLVKTSCKTEDLLGFTCPEPTAFDLQDGVYTRYPHPDNCQLHFTCIKGADGLRRPRMLSCNEGLVFDPSSSSCTRPENVPGCEEFYGPVQKPRRKPDRQPAPEEEEIEEPTPRPRRRGVYRRPRN